MQMLYDSESFAVLHLRPDLVDMANAGPQPTATFRLAAMRAGWARAPRPWDRYTEDSGAGDPRSASAEKGERFFNAVCEKFADFLVELAGAEIDEAFPFPTPELARPPRGGERSASMSSLRDAMSHAALGWVKPELDETLRQVRNEVEYYALQLRAGRRPGALRGVRSVREGSQAAACRNLPGGRFSTVPWTVPVSSCAAMRLPVSSSR